MPLPRWNPTSIFPGLESQELSNAFNDVKKQNESLRGFFSGRPVALETTSPSREIAVFAGRLIDKLNSVLERAGTVWAYLYSLVSMNSGDSEAKKKMSVLEKLQAETQALQSEISSWISKHGTLPEEIIMLDDTTRSHAFWLGETVRLSGFRMSVAEEALAFELAPTGGAAWSKLQQTITSSLAVEFDTGDGVKTLPITQVIYMRSHPEEAVRRRAYETEMAAWKTVEEPLAAALNSIKGEAIALSKRRGWKSVLDQAVDQARIDNETLGAMLSAIEESLPVFQNYLRCKAKRLGKSILSWWDIFAPAGTSETVLSWQESCELVAGRFSLLSPELGEFARRAFRENWVDAEPRSGKRTSGFCMGVPGLKESRVSINFDGSPAAVRTLAHELGHAYHHHCLFEAGKTELQQNYPMTLGETASIFCETILTEAALDQAENPGERLALIEDSLIADTQILVDTYSRFLFEKEVIERRASSELSAGELCDIMERSQIAAYGNAVDHERLMKYLWTWKPQYYYSDLSFYNFPYAFGLLFSTGLFAVFKERGQSFAPDFAALLAGTGEAPAADLAKRFSIDLREKKFWTESLAVIAEKIDRYCEL